ncbi:hypothetical protein TNIN_243421, partial [Trichonephila inaurata madagascariensis]
LERGDDKLETIMRRTQESAKYSRNERIQCHLLLLRPVGNQFVVCPPTFYES